MEIIAIIVFIAIAVRIEMAIYRDHILPNIIYDCRFNKHEVFEGDSFEIVETVMNPSRLLVPGIKAEISTNNHLEFANEDCLVNDKNRSLASLFVVHGKQKVTRNWSVKSNRRGCFKLEDTSLIGSDLFGAYHYSGVKKIKSEVIVLPKPLDILVYLPEVSESQGDCIVKRYILEDPFITAGAREYTSRDPMNRIHWAITASQGQLMVRHHETTAKKSMTVILNIQNHMGQFKEVVRGNPIELGIKIAAGEVNRSIDESIPIRLLANGYVDNEQHELDTREMWGQSHAHDLLVLLAKLSEVYSDKFDKFLDRYAASILTTEVIIITCYMDESILEFVREKKQLGLLVKIYLLAYEADSEHYEGIHVYYIYDCLKGDGDHDGY